MSAPDLVSPTPSAVPELAPDDALALLRVMLESRHGDLRQESLNRQGKGHFHVSSMGHEAMAVLARALGPDDLGCMYYRDRAFLLGRGATTHELALDYFAKRDSSTGGRQMPAHGSYKRLGFWSVATPTGAQLLPACGMAWGIQMDGRPDVVVTSIGDAATRQGDFYEAVCFALERSLPVLFVVEDNGYGISTPTRHTNPLAIGALPAELWRVVDGRSVQEMHRASVESIAKLRAGDGPVCLWVRFERLSSHTSSDDQKLYRSAEEMAALESGDAILRLRDDLIAAGHLSAEDYAKLDAELKERVRADYAAAERAEDPRREEMLTELIGPAPRFGLDVTVLSPGKYRMGDTVNGTLRKALEENPGVVLFGEDIEDPKGGVFRLTKGLTTAFPGRVHNSPLAESTILGVACGLASYGKRPIFELQFIDFIAPAWNQLVTNFSTLRWRSNGEWTCPAIIYAPCGAYLPGGSLWHSQTNEAAIAHFPGLRVVMPSTPEDAAGYFWTALHAEDPTIILLPKHLLWVEREIPAPAAPVPFGRARRIEHGDDVTVVAWGDTVEICTNALAQVGDEISADFFDLRSIVPWDREALAVSVARTGRLVVVQEDTENCSVGQMIVSALVGDPHVWPELRAAPALVSKGNVMIGYNPILEFAALPDVERVLAALRQVMLGERAAARAKPLPLTGTAEAPPSDSGPAVDMVEDSFNEPEASPQVDGDLRAPLLREAPDISGDSVASNGAAEVAIHHEVSITVPILGEGIRHARVVALLKQPGDAVSPDDPLCELETDKAVYPVEASNAGTFAEWLVAVGDTLDIGATLGTLHATDAANGPDTVKTDARDATRRANSDKTGLQDAIPKPKSDKTDVQDAIREPQDAIPNVKSDKTEAQDAILKPKSDKTDAAGGVRGSRSDSLRAQMSLPALSPAIVRRLGQVVPVYLTVNARFDALRAARRAAKERGDSAVTPSLMLAWCLVRATETVPGFRRQFVDERHVAQLTDFDFGVAVALDGDRLVTAVIPQANRLDWNGFVAAYGREIAAVRGGKLHGEIVAPVLLTSLGGFGVRTGQPILVPPAVGTLFVGEAHFEMAADEHGGWPTATEVVTLSLTFDHRVVNGAGGAAFVQEVKRRIEEFTLPS